MVLSDQAVGAIMMALQKSLMEQSDIVPALKSFILIESQNGLVVSNPPIISVDSSDNNNESTIFHHPV